MACDRAAAEQRQAERDERNKEICAAMSACPHEGERAIITVIQSSVQTEVASQLRTQGNINAVGRQNPTPAATKTAGFDSAQNRNHQKRKASRGQSQRTAIQQKKRSCP